MTQNTDPKLIRLALEDPSVCWRFQDVDNVRYFSPNSLVTAPLITAIDTNHTNPFPFSAKGEPSGFQYSTILQPRPWTAAYGWMAFVPVSLWYKEKQPGSIVGTLSHIPTIEHLTNETRTAHGYRLQDPNPWFDLERDLYSAAVALKASLHLPCIVPPLPRIFGFHNMHRTHQTLKKITEKSREWFLVWFGLLSYLLADAEYRYDPLQRSDYPPYPTWRKILKDEGFSDAWMDGLSCPPIMHFWAAHRRVGCIVNLQAVDQGPALAEWLILHGVPVWYTWSEDQYRTAWSEDQDRTAKVLDKRMHALRPPGHMLLGGYLLT